MVRWCDGADPMVRWRSGAVARWVQCDSYDEQFGGVFVFGGCSCVGVSDECVGTLANVIPL
jgi:hypothetical protein